MLFGQWLMIRYRERHLLQQVYSSFTVDPPNTDERRRTQKGLGKRISNTH
jgi:hypothetical protein